MLKKTLALLLLAVPVLVAGCGSDADQAAVPGKSAPTTAPTTAPASKGKPGPGDAAFCKRWSDAIDKIPMTVELSPEEKAGVRKVVQELSEGAPDEVKGALVDMAELYRPEPLDDETQRKADEGTAVYTKWVEEHCDIMGHYDK